MCTFLFVICIFPRQSVSSVPQSCPTLGDPMNHSTPGLPVHHQLPESTQTHIHWVGDAIQPSFPLSSPSPPALNPSQHQSLFNSESTLRIRWPKYWSFSFNICPSNEYSGLISFFFNFILFYFFLDWSLLGWNGLISLQSKGLSRVFSNTTVWKHLYFGTQPSLWSTSCI